MDARATPRILFLVGDALNQISVVLSKVWCVNPVGQDDLLAAEDGNLEEDKSTTESILSFDDYRLLHPGEESGPPLNHEIKSFDLQLGCIRQPTPPPIQAQVQSKLLPPTSMGTSDVGATSFCLYQDVHIPVKIMEDFLKLAGKNTAKELETCGVLAGSLVMLPEAIAIVMAPTDTSSPHGIFRLTDPGGVALIRNCARRGFHPHEDLEDGNPIYEACSHVYIDPDLEFDVVDLR